jgi:hypothetical protein
MISSFRHLDLPRIPCCLPPFLPQLKSRKHVSFEADSKILTLQTLKRDIVYVLMLLKLINKTEQRLTLRNCAFCLFTGQTVQLCFQAILWYYPLWGRLCRAVWGRLCRRHNVPLDDTTCPIKAKTSFVS